MIYQITARDEDALDRHEGVSTGSYVKCTLSVITDAAGETLVALVYIDLKHLTHSFPRIEYIPRVNLGIEDAIEKGIATEYFEKNIRQFIPLPTPQIIASLANNGDGLVADLKDGSSGGDIICRRLRFSGNQKARSLAYLLSPRTDPCCYSSGSSNFCRRRTITGYVTFEAHSYMRHLKGNAECTSIQG